MNELSLFNALFDNTFGNLPDFHLATPVSVPKVDVKKEKDAYTLEMDLPGRTDKDVDVELDHNVLTISSHHEETTEEKAPEKDAQNESTWLVRERRSHTFCRRFTLPEDVDAAHVGASFKNGVLHVTIPRKALATPTRIAITAG
ncbi:MAG: Hsp20/alpha crystallin family protein [Treponema sp.]|nr:Hsp20/alpha crystallin family protein [Treponema sp.]